MKKVGYARVSTVEQNLLLQTTALRNAGCEHIFVDEGVSGSRTDRVGLKRAIGALDAGDTLVVWRLDRLGRSLIHLVELLNALSVKSIEFKSLTEEIDTSSAGGRLVFHMMAALAEFERHLISERTIAGMRAAKLNGGHMGRPPILSEEQKCMAVRQVIENGAGFDEVAEHFNVHPRTIRRIINAEKEKQSAAATG